MKEGMEGSNRKVEGGRNGVFVLLIGREGEERDRVIEPT